jgi:Flp pilus assembly protein TadG
VRIHNSRSGQALVETAVMVPLLLLILLNGVNVGYFYWAAINVTEATRAGAEWSMMGNGSSLGKALPPAGDQTIVGSVAYVAFQDMSAFASTSNALVNVCMPVLTGNPPTYTSSCTNTYGTGTFTPTPDTDPEGLTLNRIDVVYQITPLIGDGWPGVWSPPSTIHRYVEMRALN